MYNHTDFDRHLVIDERTKLVAQKVTEFLKERRSLPEDHRLLRGSSITPNGCARRWSTPTPISCRKSAYVMRITGDDHGGQAQLDNFIDPESKYPVIATTSQLLSTGVDAQTCHLIVLDREVGSMTEFKQIIGRGTRFTRTPRSTISPSWISGRRPPTLRTRFRRRTGADLRTGRERSGRAAQ